MSKRNAVFPAGRQDLYTSQTYSAANQSGDLPFVSGQVGNRSDGTPEPDFEAQVRLAFALSQLDGGGRQLACRIRLRDQVDRPHSG